MEMDIERTNDIIAHYEDDFGIGLNTMVIAKRYQAWDGRFTFFYDQSEGSFPSDYLANDKGWFLVSDKLKMMMETLNTEIQYLPVKVQEKNGDPSYQYHIANILRVVDAFCLEKSDYYSTYVKKKDLTVYTVSKYAVYEEKVGGSDVFKLANHQLVPVFVSKRFKEKMEEQGISGIELRKIRTAEYFEGEGRRL